MAGWNDQIGLGGELGQSDDQWPAPAQPQIPPQLQALMAQLQAAGNDVQFDGQNLLVNGQPYNPSLPAMSQSAPTVADTTQQPVGQMPPAQAPPVGTPMSGNGQGRFANPGNPLPEGANTYDPWSQPQGWPEADPTSAVDPPVPEQTGAEYPPPDPATASPYIAQNGQDYSPYIGPHGYSPDPNPANSGPATPPDQIQPPVDPNADPNAGPPPTTTGGGNITDPSLLAPFTGQAPPGWQAPAGTEGMPAPFQYNSQFSLPANWNAPAAQFSYSQFQPPTGQQVLDSDPGYAFRQSQGQRALDASAFARGVGRTGGHLQDLLGWNQSLASQEYGSAYDRALQGHQTGYNEALGAFNANQGAQQTSLNNWLGVNQQQFGQQKSIYDTNNQNRQQTLDDAWKQYLAGGDIFHANQDSAYAKLFGTASLGVGASQ